MARFGRSYPAKPTREVRPAGGPSTNINVTAVPSQAVGQTPVATVAQGNGATAVAAGTFTQTFTPALSGATPTVIAPANQAVVMVVGGGGRFGRSMAAAPLLISTSGVGVNTTLQAVAAHGAGALFRPTGPDSTASLTLTSPAGGFAHARIDTVSAGGPIQPGPPPNVLVFGGGGRFGRSGTAGARLVDTAGVGQNVNMIPPAGRAIGGQHDIFPPPIPTVGIGVQPPAATSFALSNPTGFPIPPVNVLVPSARSFADTPNMGLFITSSAVVVDVAAGATSASSPAAFVNLAAASVTAVAARGFGQGARAVASGSSNVSAVAAIGYGSPVIPAASTADSMQNAVAAVSFGEAGGSTVLAANIVVSAVTADGFGYASADQVVAGSDLLLTAVTAGGFSEAVPVPAGFDFNVTVVAAQGSGEGAGPTWASTLTAVDAGGFASATAMVGTSVGVQSVSAGGFGMGGRFSLSGIAFSGSPPAAHGSGQALQAQPTVASGVGSVSAASFGMALAASTSVSVTAVAAGYEGSGVPPSLTVNSVITPGSAMSFGVSPAYLPFPVLIFAATAAASFSSASMLNVSATPGRNRFVARGGYGRF